jgi:tetratricopeptide (TPR) repeat protein
LKFAEKGSIFYFFAICARLLHIIEEFSSQRGERKRMSKTIIGIWALIFFYGFIFSNLALGQQMEDETAKLDGKILDMKKMPLAQAEIQLNHQATNRIFHSKSNKKGEFAFRMLFAGKYVLTVTKEGYKSYSMDVELQPGSRQEFEITLADELSSDEKNQREAFSSFQKGIELAKENRTDEAVKAFRKATELKTDFAEAYINLGILLFQQAMDEEAERVLVRALELKPEEPKTKEFLGKINFAKAKALLQDDRINEALEKLKASYSYNPDYSYTSYLLGYAYHKKENREESIKYFEAFLQMEPNAPQASQVREILESLKK